MATAHMKKIEYIDLREEARTGNLPQTIGRREEKDRLHQIFGRRLSNNIAIVGPSGIGKTTLFYGWAREAHVRQAYKESALIQLTTEHLHALAEEHDLEEYYIDAFDSLPPSVLFIDDFGREAFKNQALVQHTLRLYKSLLKNPHISVVLTLEPHEYDWLEHEHPGLIQAFETMHLKQQTSYECARILSTKLPHINTRYKVAVPDSAIREIITHAERFPSLGQLPRSAIHLLDEMLSLSVLAQHRALRRDVIARVVETKTGVPRAQLSHNELTSVKSLERQLNEHVIGQENAIHRIATTLQRAKLGLRDGNRPLGSFLLLGPSGVGKTETAKHIAELMFGRRESFVRLDMSEFQQDHTVQRLIGAPAGYVGYEEGGALTNALRKEPHSLILLDEIEKAHPKVFDVFLQVLDDGRISSGQNETIDARHCVVMATSNTAVQEITQAHAAHADLDDDTLIKEVVLPVLSKTFRLEFINRFDGILIFKPLSVEALLKIAHLEMKKVEARLEKHRVGFTLDDTTMEKHIRSSFDPRFGARPIKRFIEETCETLLVRSLLHAPRQSV